MLLESCGTLCGLQGRSNTQTMHIVLIQPGYAYLLLRRASEHRPVEE